MGLLQDQAVAEAARRLLREAPGWSTRDGHVLDCLSADSSHFAARPAAAAFPPDAAGAALVVGLAARLGAPVTARGGGTGLAGGALGRGIALDLRRLDSVRVEGESVVVGPGAPKGRVDAELASRGLFLGPNPSVGPYCTMGGMVGTNAAGSRSLKYGAVVDNLLGVEFVDGTGALRRLPGPGPLAGRIAAICAEAGPGAFPAATKNSCGYRLDAARRPGLAHRVMAGSEGTLGVVVSARLRAHRLPRRRRLAVLAYARDRDAFGECPALLRAGPSALEFAGGAVAAGMGRRLPAGTGCVLLAEFDGVRGADGPPAGLRGRPVADTCDAAESAAWWRGRDLALSRTLGGGPARHVMEDAAVPVGRLGGLADAIGRAAARTGSRPVVYGHAGSGNLHVRLAGGREATPGVVREYFRSVRRLGGTITGEHGDGMARTRFSGMQYGPATRALFARLKSLLDPRWVLNPGKVVAAPGRGRPQTLL